MQNSKDCVSEVRPKGLVTAAVIILPDGTLPHGRTVAGPIQEKAKRSLDSALSERGLIKRIYIWGPASSVTSLEESGFHRDRLHFEKIADNTFLGKDPVKLVPQLAGFLREQGVTLPFLNTGEKDEQRVRQCLLKAGFPVFGKILPDDQLKKSSPKGTPLHRLIEKEEPPSFASRLFRFCKPRKRS